MTYVVALMCLCVIAGFYYWARREMMLFWMAQRFMGQARVPANEARQWAVVTFEQSVRWDMLPLWPNKTWDKNGATSLVDEELENWE